MAFNPFRAFRKYGKVIFAVMTIVCMLTFVLSSGLPGISDIFTEAGRLFGGSGRRGPASNVVATLHGQKITEADLFEIKQQRQAVNFAIHYLVVTSVDKVIRDVSRLGQQGQATSYEFTPPQIQTLQRPIQQLMTQQMGSHGFPLPQLDQMVNELKTNKKDREVRLVQQLRRVLEVMNDPILSFTYTAWVRSSMMGQEKLQPFTFYFGGNTQTDGFGATIDAESALEFLMWRKEADRLGIKLNSANVAKLLTEETFEQEVLKGDGTDAIVKNLLQRFALSGSSQKPWDSTRLYQAFADEYRVGLARNIILGEDPARPKGRQPAVVQTPSAVPPAEFVKYYKDNATSLTVKMLRIPVSDPEFQPKEEPDPRVLEGLFNQGKNKEFTPEDKLVGFKVPMQHKLAWLTSNLDSPMFKQNAKLQTQAAELGVHFALASSNLLANTGSVALLPSLNDLQISQEFSDHKSMLTIASSRSWVGEKLKPTSYDSITYSNETIASTVGSAFASACTLTPPLSVLASPQGYSAKLRENQVGTALGWAFGTKSFVQAAMPLALVPETQLLAHLRPKLTEKIAQRAEGTQLKSLARKPLEEIQRKMSTLASTAKPKEVQEWFVNEVLLTRPDLQVAGLLSTSAGNAFSATPYLWQMGRVQDNRAETFANQLAQAKEGSAVVQPKQLASWLAAGASQPLTQALWLKAMDNGAREFYPTPTFNLPFTAVQNSDWVTAHSILEAKEFTALKELYNKTSPEDKYLTRFASIMLGGDRQGRSLYAPDLLAGGRVGLKEPDDTKDLALYWTTETKPSYVPKLEEVQEKVKASWRQQRARVEAEKKAKAIVEEVKGDLSGRKLLDIASQRGWGNVFTLGNVSRLVSETPTAPMMMRQGGGYKEYKVNESDWDRIRYQHPEMVDTLLKDLQKAGDVTIVRDKPEQHLYVVVCENRIEPELNEIYRQEFQGTTGRPVTGMWQHQFAQQQRSYREKALKLQRQSAGMLDEAGKPAYTFSDDFRKSFTARGTDGE